MKIPLQLEWITFFFAAAIGIFNNAQTEYIQYRVCRQLAEEGHVTPQLSTRVQTESDASGSTAAPFDMSSNETLSSTRPHSSLHARTTPDTAVTTTTAGSNIQPSKSPSTFCNSDLVTSTASQWSLYVLVAATVPASIVSPMFGVLSDKHGRKDYLLLPLVGTTLMVVAVMLIVAYGSSLQLMVIISAVWGLSGGLPLALMAFFSSLIDQVQPKDRTFRVGVLEGFLCAGLFVGSLAGGIVTQQFGFLNTFVLVVACCAAGVILSFLMPETLQTKHRQMSVSWKEANLVAALVTLCKNRTMTAVSLAFILGVLAYIGPMPVLVLYGGYKFDWDATTIGYFGSADRGTRAIALLGVLPLLHLLPRNSFLRRDIVLAVGGFIFQTIQFCLYGVVSTTPLMFALTALGPISGLPVPILRSMASKCFPRNQQGRVMAAFATVEGISELLGPFVFNEVYPVTVDTFPGMFIVVAGILTAICALLMVLVRSKDMVEQPEGDRPGKVIPVSINDGDDEIGPLLGDI